MIIVKGYDGQKIGTATNFPDAKEMQIADIKEPAPHMLDSYEGVSTQLDSLGLPVFAKA